MEDSRLFTILLATPTESDRPTMSDFLGTFYFKSQEQSEAEGNRTTTERS